MTAPARDERLLRDLRTVLQVSRALGAERDLDRLLPQIVAAATSLVEADRTSLFVVDRERGQLWSRVAEGSGEIRVPLSAGIAGSVASGGQGVNIPDAYADARFDPANDRRSGYRTRSILCLPMVNHAGQVVGVIQALNKRGGQPFDVDDEAALAALASQAAVALDNAQLVLRDRERERLARDMEIARQIQLSLLPGSAPARAGWRCAAWARACDATGGDYYDFLDAPDGGIDLVVGDVTGHGIGAAMLMSTARATLRALHGRERDPAILLGALDVLLDADMADDAFMSLCLCRLAAGGGMTYVTAGHEPPLVWRSSTRTWDALESTGLLLGLMPGTPFGVAGVPSLAPGDIVVLLTDGFFEAQAPPAFEQFGLERVRAAIERGAAGGAAGVRDAVVEAAVAWLGGHAPHDDMTLVVAERTA